MIIKNREKSNRDKSLYKKVKHKNGLIYLSNIYYPTLKENDSKGWKKIMDMGNPRLYSNEDSLSTCV